MNKNQKMLMSAATLAVIASSVSGACSAASESANQTTANPTAGVDTASAYTTSASTSASATSIDSAGGTYVDGSYTGSAASTRWGDVQVSVVISGGSIADIQFLAYPDGDSRSAQINAEATVALVQEAIQSQSSSVQVISGATFTSQAFMQSLDSALTQAL